MSLPILLYHALGPARSPLATDPAWFAASMATLASAGFQAVDLGDWIARGRPVVDRGFALTFDDGLDSLPIAAEVLARHGFAATAFLVTDRVGTDNGWPGQPRSVPRWPLLGWPDLAALSSAGFRFGAHTRTHPRLDRIGNRRLESELRGSRAEIEARLGASCPLLAYPYGNAPPPVRQLAAQHFDAALGTRLDLADRLDDAYALPRIDACYLRTPRALDRLISGRWQTWLRVRRTLREVRGLVRA
jgi:peptidoglycan/xylan/chitin deacetylase (PgdA/CDA1 family)